VSTWARVPVKARSAGKQRLATALPEPARAQLVRLMLRHVLGVLADCPEIDNILVMSPERDEVPPGIEWLSDPAAQMNDALLLAVRELQARGATCVAIIAADLPLLAAAEVRELVRAGVASGTAIAPDRGGTGTNALCVRLPTAFRFQFGPGSFAAHSEQLMAGGRAPLAVAQAGLAFDVDLPADLETLVARGASDYSFLR
jgi:2-phospho-L-lactate/phosphoenolpyruvate guanylyltransferase